MTHLPNSGWATVPLVQDECGLLMVSDQTLKHSTISIINGQGGHMHYSKAQSTKILLKYLHQVASEFLRRSFP